MPLSRNDRIIVEYFYERDRHNTILNLLDYLCMEYSEEEIPFRKMVHELINKLEAMSDVAFLAINLKGLEGEIETLL